MYARFTAFAVWALLAGSLVFWALQLAVSPLPAPSQVLAAAEGAPARVDLSRLLGSSAASVAANAEPAAESRFRLLGLGAPRKDSGSGEGVALIAVDGNPAKPVRVGAVVDGDVLLLSLSVNSVGLGVKGTAESARMVLRLQPPPLAINAPIGSNAPPGAGNSPAPNPRGGAAPEGGAISGGPMGMPGNVPFRVGGLAALPVAPGMSPAPQPNPNPDAPAMPQFPLRPSGEPTR